MNTTNNDPLSKSYDAFCTMNYAIQSWRQPISLRPPKMVLSNKSCLPCVQSVAGLFHCDQIVLINHTIEVVDCRDHCCLPPLARFDLAQTWEYADCSAPEEAHLVIFDRTPGKPWSEKIWQRSERYQDWPITVWGM